MRSVLVISLIAIFCVVFLSARKLGDNIANFKGCIQACRAQNNTFRFCTGFCTPSKPHQVAKKHAEEGKKILKEILGDNYENEADSEQNLNVPDSKGLWEKYRTVLKDFFRQGNPNALPGLQLVPNPLPADWDIQPEILTNFCNRIPKWGSVYEPSSNEVTVQYGDWIYNINAPQVRSIAPNTFSGVDDRLRSAERAINNAELDCMDAFDMRYGNRRSLAGPPPTYDEYMGRFCPRIDRANKEYDMALADYEIQQRQVYGEHFALARSIAKYSTAQRMNKFPWVTLGSMQRFVESAKDNRTNAFEIKITSKTTVTTEKTFSMNIGVGFSYADFASITANYQTSKLDFKTSTDELQLIVGAAGYKVFPVYPDRSWFSPELFQKYKNSPLRNPKNYFGKDGALPMMPKTFIVVVGPRLTMLVSHEDASKVEKSSQFGVKLTVAGFSFDFAKNASLKKSKESANLFKITIEGNSYEPQVLAVDNELFADV